MDASIMIKPMAAGAFAVLLDRNLIGESDMTRNAYFGVAVAVGIYASQFVTPLADLLPGLPSLNNEMYEAKTLTKRIVEVSSGSASAYFLHKFILMNDTHSEEFLYRIGIVAASDFVGEYVSDYLAGEPLAYFTGN